MNKILIILFFISNFSFSQENEECTFDQSTQTDEFVKNIPEFSNYKWNNIKKEATIKLKNGDELIARRGGCVHFGISGELFEKKQDGVIYDEQHWFEKIKWIAEKLFSKSDYNLLIESFKNKTFNDLSDNNTTYIVIPHKTYDEFMISVREENDNVIIYIGYYF